MEDIGAIHPHTLKFHLTPKEGGEDERGLLLLLLLPIDSPIKNAGDAARHYRDEASSKATI